MDFNLILKKLILISITIHTTQGHPASLKFSSECFEEKISECPSQLHASDCDSMLLHNVNCPSPDKCWSSVKDISCVAGVGWPYSRVSQCVWKYPTYHIPYYVSVSLPCEDGEHAKIQTAAYVMYFGGHKIFTTVSTSGKCTPLSCSIKNACISNQQTDNKTRKCVSRIGVDDELRLSWQETCDNTEDNTCVIKVPRKDNLACDNIPTDEIDMVKQCGKDTVLSTGSHCYSDHVEMQYSCEKRAHTAHSDKLDTDTTKTDSYTRSNPNSDDVMNGKQHDRTTVIPDLDSYYSVHQLINIIDILAIVCIIMVITLIGFILYFCYTITKQGNRYDYKNETQPVSFNNLESAGKIKYDDSDNIYSVPQYPITTGPIKANSPNKKTYPISACDVTGKDQNQPGFNVRCDKSGKGENQPGFHEISLQYDYSVWDDADTVKLVTDDKLPVDKNGKVKDHKNGAGSSTTKKTSDC